MPATIVHIREIASHPSSPPPGYAVTPGQEAEQPMHPSRAAEGHSPQESGRPISCNDRPAARPVASGGSNATKLISSARHKRNRPAGFPETPAGRKRANGTSHVQPFRLRTGFTPTRTLTAAMSMTSPPLTGRAESRKIPGGSSETSKGATHAVHLGHQSQRPQLREPSTRRWP